MNVLFNKNEVKQSENTLYVNQIEGTCYNCGKYMHNRIYCMTEKRTSTLCTEINMNTLQKTVSTRNNVHTVTRRVTKKMNTGRNKNIKKRKKRRRLMLLKRQFMTKYFLGDDTLAFKKENINKRIE